MLRDVDIRRPLHGWLENRYRRHCHTKILSEMNIPRPSARIDIAVVNGELAGYEIKSDADSLARLPIQMRAFNRVFDKVFLVTTERHLSAAIALVPEFWGLATSSQYGNDVRIRTRRQASKNLKIDLEAQLHLLNLIEIITILKDANVVARASKLRRNEAIRLLTDNIAERNLRGYILDALKSRT
ncbi:sce7726 family protein [Parvibaculum sp.]|uniref:sce7726 family protein n=1 Tax=Parvibaculum sp. TaxID=2024848 RepID=UPI0025DA689C|nr:sce7726 family protein [Parvibaculum sp.]